MIQRSKQKPGTDRRILSFPAVHPYEGISPQTLLGALIPLARRICNFDPKSFSTQRRNSREVIRQIGILLIFFEEIRDRGSVLPSSVVLSLSELHLAFQKILFLLEDCSREGGRVWILMKCQFVAMQFRVLIRSIATALDVLPMDLVDICGEVKELVELVAKQARKAKIGIEQGDEQAMNRVVTILNLFEKGIKPEQEFIKPVLDYLRIKNWVDCNAEVKFLEDQIEFEYSDCEEREVPFLSSLLAFMCYNRVVLFKAVEHQNRGDRIDVRFNPETLNCLNPEDFRCPISLDVMTDPVIISSGQTYDRLSIQKWLKAGNRHCPITGQRLANAELVPNTALKKLIFQFCEDNGISLAKSRKQGHEMAWRIAPGSRAAAEAMEFLSRFLAWMLVFGSDDEKNKAAYEIRLLAKTNVFNRSRLVESGTIPPLVNLLSSSDKSTQENAIAALLKLSKHTNGKKVIVETGGLNPILGVLKNGLSMEAKQIAAATIFYISSIKGYRKTIGESPDAIPSLVELVKNATTCGKKNAVVALFALILYPKTKERVLSTGLIPLLISMISSSEKSELVTDSLAILAELSETIEGTFAILQCLPLPLLVKTLRTSSSRAAKDYCVSILLSLCKNGGDEVIADLAKDSSLVALLYSHVTEGSSSGGKRACSLIDILQDFQESTPAALRR